MHSMEEEESMVVDAMSTKKLHVSSENNWIRILNMSTSNNHADAVADAVAHADAHAHADADADPEDDDDVVDFGGIEIVFGSETETENFSFNSTELFVSASPPALPTSSPGALPGALPAVSTGFKVPFSSLTFAAAVLVQIMK
jgi:hypothetical protein